MRLDVGTHLRYAFRRSRRLARFLPPDRQQDLPQGPRMISRRTVLRGLGAGLVAGAGIIGYGVEVEGAAVPRIARYAVTPPRWPAGHQLRIAALSDIHACEPWMPAERVQEFARITNALAPDVVLLVGDFTTRHRWFSDPVPHEAWAKALAAIKAPLGVFAVQGNHDMWDDDLFQERRTGPTRVRRVLEAHGIPVLDNEAVRIANGGRPFWIAGLADQWAFSWGRNKKLRPEKFGYEGLEDLPGTLAKVTDDAPVILMAHEPDIFPQVPERISLTVSGHMHHGQVRLMGYAPITPSRYGQRYVYGHIVEEGRHLIVSGGLGCSGLPLRISAPPEILMIELGSKEVVR